MNRLLASVVVSMFVALNAAGQPFVVSYTANSNPCATPQEHRLVMTDSTNGKVVADSFRHDPQNHPCTADEEYLWQTTSDASAGAPCASGQLEPTIVEVVPREYGNIGVSGFDIKFRYHNTSGVRKGMGKIQMPNFRLETTGTVRRHFESDGREVALNATFTHAYPGNAFSPVVVIRGTASDTTGGSAEYVVGVSMLYPVLEYRHAVATVVTPNGGGNFRVAFNMNPCLATNGGQPGSGVMTTYHEAGDLADGEVRDFVVAVRAMRADLLTDESNAWLRVLEPYRKYFQTTYGSTRFARTATPIRGLLMANLNYVTTSNPYGLERTGTSDPSHDTTCERPDRDAWASAANVLDSLASEWPRRVMWTMSGVYQPGSAQGSLNYLYNFATRLDAGLTGSSSCSPTDTLAETEALASHAFESGGLGVYWGRTRYYQPSHLSLPADIEEFDATNTTHRRGAFAELDRAESFGTTYVGLDDFLNRSWEVFDWLEDLSALYPRIKFATEPNQSDLIHLHGPSYIRLQTLGVPAANPHWLAHYLVPQNEVSVYFDAGGENFYPGATGDARMRNASATLAANGYVALSLTSILDPYSYQDPMSTHTATSPWSSTIPASVRTPWFPTISTHPATPSGVTFGGTYALSVTATSPRSEPLTYQWELLLESNTSCGREVAAIQLVDDPDFVSGATTATLTLSNLNYPRMGVYRCVVRDGHGPAYSRQARVATVNSRHCQRLDFNADGNVNADDLGDIFNAVLSSDPAADFNCSGDVNSDDSGDYLNEYFGDHGCL